ncbi:hypothetical protein C2G38_2189071 [Gigaspora rosea]|uniref:Uncharacterized protein n=1 Tax=Gigaspora rosea TaxID=44941 RepID=A0A397V2Y2_9GLOM|nr:hypothetical protein C2G38_2189071 [Gigaspora rosea]
MCNSTTYTLEDLENPLKIKQDSALKFRVKFNFILGRYKDAIIDITKLLDIEPNNEFALRYRGEAYHLTGQCRKTIIDLTKLLDIEPNNKFALRYRGEAYYLIERYKEAIIDLTKLLNIEPNSKFALRYLGEAYHITEEAIIDLAKLLCIEPSDYIDESLKKKLIEAFNMCNIEDLENLLEINQDTALKFRVKFNFIMQRYEDAIVELTKLLGIEPSDVVDELLKKKWIKAFNMCNSTTKTYTLEDLENSLKIKQDSALKFRVKFNILGRYKDAIIDLTKLLDIEPNNKFALREAYYLAGKYKDTIIDLTKLFGIEPSDVADELLKKNGSKRLICAIMLRHIKRYKDAIIDLTKLLDIEPNNKFALRHRGEAYHLMGRYKDAIIDLTKLFGIEPSDVVDELLKKNV